jgi:hypothetical protein
MTVSGHVFVYRGIDFVSFYNFSNGFWNGSDSVVFFVCHFIEITDTSIKSGGVRLVIYGPQFHPLGEMINFTLSVILFQYFFLSNARLKKKQFLSKSPERA